MNWKGPKDHTSLGILAHLLRMVMEPKYLAFRRWLQTPIILWRSVIRSHGTPGPALLHSLQDQCWRVGTFQYSYSLHVPGPVGKFWRLKKRAVSWVVATQLLFFFCSSRILRVSWSNLTVAYVSNGLIPQGSIRFAYSRWFFVGPGQRFKARCWTIVFDNLFCVRRVTVVSCILLSFFLALQFWLHSMTVCFFVFPEPLFLTNRHASVKW